MGKYTDYCTCFYAAEENTVYFWDEIKDKAIEKKKVNNREEAEVVMRIWQDNSPEGVICQLLNKDLLK